MGTAVVVAGAVNEPYAAFAIGTPNFRPEVIVGFDDRVVTASLTGWAYGQPPPPPLTNNTFTHCNVLTTSCGVTPPIPGYDSPKGGGNTGVAVDQRGHVVMVALASTGQTTSQEAVAAYISEDNGQHFQYSTRVNVGPCSNGYQDQPHAAFDLTTEPPTLWVVWRHNGAGSYGACIKSGTLNLPNASQPIVWNDEHVVENLRGATFYGMASLMVQAGDGGVTVVEQFNGNPGTCPSQTQPFYEGWGSVYSPDGGAHWLANTKIHETNDFIPCAFAGQHQKNLRDFSYVRSFSKGHDYVAVNDSRSTIRVFHSRSQGWAWREIFRATPTGTQGQPDSTRSVLYPTLAVDGNGRLGLFYYESNPAMTGIAVDTRSRGVFCATSEPDGPSPNWSCEPLSQDFSVFSKAPGVDPYRPWGDWAGMTAVGPIQAGCAANGTFFPTWCRVDPGSTADALPEIVTAEVVVGP